MPADPKLGLGAGPSQVILDLEHRWGEFAVYNAGELATLVTLTPHDLYINDQGAPQVSSMELPQGASGWVRFPDLPESRFTLDPGQSKTVRFMLDVPDAATPGDHASRITIRGSFTDEAWARYREAYPQSGDAINILSAVQFGVDAVIRVPGPIIPDLEVPGFEVFLPGIVSTGTGDYTFKPEIVNTGNVAAVWMPRAGAGQTLEAVVPTLHLAPNGGLFAQPDLLFDGSIRPDGSVSLSPLVVLPGASYTQRLTLRDAPLVGTYDYIYKVPGSVADGRADIIRTGTFTIINLQKVLYWIVLPLLALMVLLSLTFVGRRRRTLNRRTADALKARELQKARLEGYEQAWRDQLQAQGRRGRG